MPCLEGAAAAASSLAPHGTEFDGAAFGLAAFMGTRVNNVGQNFNRRMTAIDYKLKKQKLHREDIKDLIELTTARMHIYQLVGTLLLAFSMGWYTDSTIWNLPVWYSSLWLISNYGAVGYLILCVWLAMYAAVAARSIGTRLLTSYARLAFPTADELEEVKNPIVCNLGKTGKSLKSMFKREVPNGDGAISNLPKEELALSEDDCQHFKRFLDELPRWLVYDTWARVCMTYGMNQLLQALSYFSMAVIWAKSPMAAIISFVTINNLAIILLWLDLGQLDQTWWDLFAIAFFNFLPGLLAVILLLQEFWIGPNLKSLLVAVCFMSHGAWLWYLNNVFQHAGSTNGRFQPGNYANVLEWVRPNQNSAGESSVVDDGQRSSAQNLSDKLVPDGDDHQQASEPAMSNEVYFENVCAQAKLEMNGGRSPGEWMKPIEQHAAQFSRSNIWLPVKVVKYFTLTTVMWWCLAGILHGIVIDFDATGEYKPFTGDDQMAPLTATLLQWPQPSGLFKVEALHCSNSQLWISSRFSMFAVSPENNKTTKSMTFIKDGNVGAVICGPRTCDTLSAPDVPDGDWTLSPLDSVSEAASIPIPHNWRLVSGSWIDCPQTGGSPCTTAWLAGWDGVHVYAATLQKDGLSSAWAVHTQFEVDPALGCTSGIGGCGKGHHNYNDVQALDLSEGGSTLLVLLGSGAIDVWDLSKGVVRERLRVGEGFTSMCQDRKHIFLAREGVHGPIVDRMTLPPVLAQLMKPRRMSFISLNNHVQTKNTTRVDSNARSLQTQPNQMSGLAHKLRGAPSLTTAA